MTPIIVGIPIKPFGIAKARLSSVLDARTRSRVGKAIAAHTAGAVADSGARPVIVTADRAVAAWAAAHDWEVISEPPGGGLNGAATEVASAAGMQRWAVLHADLPMLDASDLHAAWQLSGTVLAPSHDGGTSLVVAEGSFPFSYGPSSFHRHAAARPGSGVLSRPGLALDLDTPADLRVALTCRAGSWLQDLMAEADVPIPSETPRTRPGPADSSCI